MNYRHEVSSHVNLGNWGLAESRAQPGDAKNERLVDRPGQSPAQELPLASWS